MHGTHLEDLTTKIKPRTASNLLLWFIVGFVVVFFLWAAFTELDRTVRGQGRVIPSSRLQVVSNLEGGIVQDILVRSGQQVRQGDELIRLDPTMTGSELGSGEATVSALSVKIARLTAEITGREPVYPAASNPVVAGQIRIEQALHTSRMADLSSLLGAARARMAQVQRSVAEAESAYQARTSALQQRRQELRMVRPLVERGIEPRLTLVQAQSAADIAQSEAEGAAESVRRARSGVAEAEATLAQAQQNWRATAANELASAQAELNARQQTLPALANRVERTVLRAPLAGRVNRVLISTRGGSIRAGEPVVEIVPSEETLLVEARIAPDDIAFVSMGQPARIAVTAYDRSIYGVLEGSVVGISPDAVLEERTGETYYVVRVRTTENALRGNDGRLMPIGVGMVAEVDLLGEKRTILQYLLTPITRLSETAFREQ